MVQIAGLLTMVAIHVNIFGALSFGHWLVSHDAWMHAEVGGQRPTAGHEPNSEVGWVVGRCCTCGDEGMRLVMDVDHHEWQDGGVFATQSMLIGETARRAYTCLSFSCPATALCHTSKPLLWPHITYLNGNSIFLQLVFCLDLAAFVVRAKVS